MSDRIDMPPPNLFFPAADALDAWTPRIDRIEIIRSRDLREKPAGAVVTLRISSDGEARLLHLSRDSAAWIAGELAKSVEPEIESGEAEVARLRDALEKIANYTDGVSILNMPRHGVYRVLDLARAALAPVETPHQDRGDGYTHSEPADTCPCNKGGDDGR